MQTGDTGRTDAPARVLIVVGQRLVCETIKLALNHGVYATRDADELAEATNILNAWRPHLAILDMDIGGDAILRQIGGHGPTGGTRTPVLALTRRGDLQTKLAAFERGVDDVMTMPFSPEELLARVLVITRRTYGQDAPFNPRMRVGDLEIDMLHRRVYDGGDEIHLTGQEQSLLYLLAANPGRAVTRDEILDTLWGTDFVSESNVVDRHVRGLRAKLQDNWREPRYIATVPGKGYRFMPTHPDRATGT